MKKEKAIKLIDTHTVCFYNEIDSSTLQALHMAIEALQNDTIEFDFNKYQPSVRNKVYDKHDWVKVVRCKNCRHRVHDEERGLYYCEMYYGQGDVSDENFCQWGEWRKE